MVEVPARVRSDGGITLPADVRRELGIAHGDYVVVDIRDFEGRES